MKEYKVKQTEAGQRRRYGDTYYTFEVTFYDEIIPRGGTLTADYKEETQRAWCEGLALGRKLTRYSVDRKENRRNAFSAYLERIEPIGEDQYRIIIILPSTH